MKIHGTTTADDLLGLHPALDRGEVALALGTYWALCDICRELDIDVYHIQVCIRARPMGHGRFLFFEMGGGDVSAWVAPPPPEFIWGPFKPKAQARVWHPMPTPHDIPHRGGWLYPLEDT